MARRILFTSQKGGVGKSTLARAVAVSLVSSGRRVVLADFDRRQRTCMRWLAQRQARHLEPAVKAVACSKAKDLTAVENGYDDVIMDTHGDLDKLAVRLIVSADVIFLPSSYSFDDLLPTLRVAESIRNAGIPPSRVAIVFCRTGHSEKQERQARSILEVNRVAAIEPVLPQKDGFISLQATGRTAREASDPHLRSTALALDGALLNFIDAAAA